MKLEELLRSDRRVHQNLLKANRNFFILSVPSRETENRKHKPRTSAIHKKARASIFTMSKSASH